MAKKDDVVEQETEEEKQARLEAEEAQRVAEAEKLRLVFQLRS